MKNLEIGSLIGRKVRIYRNLHKNCYSVQDAKTRRVIAYRDYIALENATFVVSEAGRQRVLRDHKKNVHAFVVGTVLDPRLILNVRWHGRAKYSPYSMETFRLQTHGGFSGLTETQVKTATVALCEERGVYVSYPNALLP